MRITENADLVPDQHAAGIMVHRSHAPAQERWRTLEELNTRSNRRRVKPATAATLGSGGDAMVHVAEMKGLEVMRANGRVVRSTVPPH